MFPGLIVSKRGSPQTGGGTWLHPDLAIQLAQWCNTPFALQVSRWVREWMTTGQNPVRPQQADIDRVIYRDALKDEARLRMTNQVKTYLVSLFLCPWLRRIFSTSGDKSFSRAN
jgi:KilA-N domain